MKKYPLFLFVVALLVSFSISAQSKKQKKAAANKVTTSNIKTGADNLDEYLPMLKGKRVALFANQTSVVGDKHLVDVLLKNNIDIKKIFSPEHGFRGDADAGEHVSNSIDKATKLPIVSLYGDHHKATAEDLKDVDILVFDLQDVGCRFYTYINSLQTFMESAIETDKPLLVLDRPNPNGFYVDGPILEKGFESGVGVQHIPIVYGMTIGEYGKMLLGEKWLKVNPTAANSNFSLTIIKCKNYTHASYYELPVKPSPNLPNIQSILLYPSICFFEGTNVSLGRGTDKPFQMYGCPEFPTNLYSFTPVSTAGAKTPPLMDKKCFGYDLSSPAIDITQKQNQQINLSYIINAYKLYPNKDSFFLIPKKGNPSTSDYFFNKLAGNENLMYQLMNNKTEAEIRKSWQPGINTFKMIRAKYLLYP
jgi:uncharacterized protein YbbC (DUF1343 family)